MTLLEKQLIVKVYNMERALSALQQHDYAHLLLQEVGCEVTSSVPQQLLIRVNKLPAAIKYRCLRNAISNK